MQDVFRGGFDDFATWVNPVAAARAALSGEPVRLLRVVDGGALADADGRIYEDFISGFGTQALGHRNPTWERRFGPTSTRTRPRSSRPG